MTKNVDIIIPPPPIWSKILWHPRVFPEDWLLARINKRKMSFLEFGSEYPILPYAVDEVQKKGAGTYNSIGCL